MDFAGLDWDEGNREKCAKHGVSAHEVEEVLRSSTLMLKPDDKNSVTESRYLAIGQTASGRYAFVVFTPRLKGEEIRLRPISARYMHAKEVRKYVEEAARLQNR